ncbi:hypothetical protein [Streptomyces aureoversilis]|uniref:Uncharacterized protein n=1 Tax=Streptomyces aureoversilis TaxID=67277 RepID=A0ABV9ZUT3_9ACTN
MTINNIQPPPQLPAPLTERLQYGHRAALAVAEHLLNISPVPPREVTTTYSGHALDTPRVDLHFFGSSDGVEALAEVLGVPAESGPHAINADSTYTSMTTMLAGVTVRAWSLVRSSQGAEAVSR